MVLFTKQKIKIMLSMLLAIIASIIIYSQMRKPTMTVSKISADEKYSKFQIKGSLVADCDMKLYQKTEDESEFTEVKDKVEGKSILKKDETFKMNTEDKAKPNNVTNLNTSIVDDYIIVSFDEAKDNGTEYEYYFSGSQNNNIETKTSKIYSMSGIKGYNYIIDNKPNTETETVVNKLDSKPILYSDINWNQNYYLHIKAIDNNNNLSETLHYKINLPSKGVKMQYIDTNNYSEISPSETIIGNANDKYNINEYNKTLKGYKLINIDGEQQGTLKKERINIKYMYAKESNVVVRYYNKLTGKEISNPTYIEGYEGKEYKVNPKKIKNYKYNSSDKIEGKMLAGNNEVNLYYDEISNVDVSYVNYTTGKSIIPDEKISGIVGNSYNTKAKELIGYELFKIQGDEQGEFVSNNIKITYYYKAKANLIIKHIDVDTNKILEKEKIEGYEGDKLTIKSKEFEGYVLKDSNKEESDENIIDEILQEESLDNKGKNEKKVLFDNSFQQYDIVMSCGDAEYIIYYKKR